MRVLPLAASGAIYTANSYLILGDWSRLEDVNALIDPGRDPLVLQGLDRAPTGVGKRKVDLVVLTHSHYDHVELAPRIREKYHAKVAALSDAAGGVDELLEDGQRLRMGDDWFDVIAIHGHTSDSLCLYNEAHGVLFSGDAPLFIHYPGGDYEPEFLTAMETLCRRDVRVIYPGHGQPVFENCNSRLRESVWQIREFVAGQSDNQTRRTR